MRTHAAPARPGSATPPLSLQVYVLTSTGCVEKRTASRPGQGSIYCRASRLTDIAYVMSSSDCCSAPSPPYVPVPSSEPSAYYPPLVDFRLSRVETLLLYVERRIWHLLASCVKKALEKRSTYVLARE
jgi:hypothetical protein